VLHLPGGVAGRSKNMSDREQIRQFAWAAVAFAICFFAGGWSGSYRDYLHAGFHWEIAALFVGVAMVLTWFADVGLLVSAITVSLALPAIILVRVILDGLDDPTSHNLWPFEIALASVIGMIVAFPAAFVGRLFRFLTHWRSKD
jgi:hypothetical protein